MTVFSGRRAGSPPLKVPSSLRRKRAMFLALV